MNRFPASGRNTRVGSALWAAAGLAALAVAALGSSTRRSALLRDRGGSHLGDPHRFGRRDDDRDRGGMTGASRSRDAGPGYGTHGRSGWDRDEAEHYGGQDPSRRMMGSAYGGYGQGGPEGDRDYRGRGYGSDYLHGGYDPDNDYRRDMSGYGGGGRGMGSILGASGRSEDDDRRGGDSSQRFRGDKYRLAGDEQGGSETSGHGGYAGTTLMAVHRGRGPKNYIRSDNRIREDVCDRLTDDPHIDASEIDVRVANGEVTLSGTVTDRTAMRHAEDLAERIGGVRHMQNNLRVSPAGAPAGTSGVSATTSSTIDTADVAGAIGITGAPDQTIASGT